MKLEGKVAAVTGAGSGMGKAIAVAYAREGARIIVADLNLNAAQAVADEIAAAVHVANGVMLDRMAFHGGYARTGRHGSKSRQAAGSTPTASRPRRSSSTPPATTTRSCTSTTPSSTASSARTASGAHSTPRPYTRRSRAPERSPTESWRSS